MGQAADNHKISAQRFSSLNCLCFIHFDIALKKDFFNRRLSLTFRIQDLFKTQKFENITTAPGFTADMTRSRDSRVAFLTLTYRFGTDSNNKDKKKKQDDNNNNNGVEEDY